MEFLFTDIPEGFFKAKLSQIKKEKGTFGQYLRLTFIITEEGKLKNYKFSGIVNPNPLKQSKFYRWITNILGYPPEGALRSEDIIGRECKIYLAKQNNYYTVIDVSMKMEET
jgi:hypothetical protein